MFEGEGVTKLSRIGLSNARAVCGGVERVGAVIGEAVSGEAVSVPMLETRERLFVRS